MIQVANNRRYWAKTVRNALIQETMSINRLEKIKSIVSDNTEIRPRDDLNHVRLFIRPVLKRLIDKSKSVPFESWLSVDEQLCSTKCKSYLKQYLPMKPKKWGFKQ